MVNAIRKPLSILLVSGSLLALAACGEGYERRPYHGVPYTHERTAGYGVEYVRAIMMPERGPNLEPVAPKAEKSPPSTPPSEESVKSAEPVFENNQKK